ncbi:MAG: MFS transporter [Myxococcales bacterium]|nr:MFS transporter [Myxococcales bacterium]
MRLARNVVLLGVVSFFADVSSDMVMPLLPAFLVSIGAGAAYLGVIEGAAEATAALLKYVSGRWADSARRLLPLAVVGYALAAVARPFLSIARAPWQVLAIRNVDRVGKGIRTSPRDKLLAASTAPERLAEAFAFHRGMDHAGAALGPLLATALLLLWPGDLRRVFLLAAIPGGVAVLALFAVREEPATGYRPPATGELPRAKSRVPPGLLAAIGLFTLGNSTDALLVLRAQTVGVPTAQLPLLWALLHVVRSLLSWPAGRAADVLGRRRALIAGWLWYAACYAGFAFAEAPSQMWALFAAYGLVAALTEGSERALIAAAVPSEQRGRALGIYNLVSGVGLLAASILAGEVWERVSPAAALFLGAVLAFGAALVLFAAHRPAAPVPA